MPQQRVLIIGLDGATYDVLTPLAEMGVMPNLARLMQEAALAELASTRPYITPVAWTTFQTGCDPETHGVLDYRWLDHSSRRLRLNQADRIGCPTLFDAVSAAGGECVSLNLPMTYPPPPGAPGMRVGGLDCPSIEAALRPYPRFAERLRSSGARFNLSTVWKRKPQSLEELTHYVAETQADFLGRVAATRIADDLTDWRLIVVQFQTLDALQHRCWHLLGIDEASTAPASWVARLRQALATLDDCLGELLELASRRQAAVLVVSDHGFGPFRGKVSLPSLLEQRGLMVSSGLTSRLGRHCSRAQWKARKWLWRQLRPGTSTASLERPLASLLPIDWKRTSAVTLHGNLAALAYLNTEQRFGGPVATPRQAEQAAADLMAALAEARHPETGEPLFAEVYSVAERFGFDPLERCWPDVIGIPAPGWHTRSKLDADRALIQTDPHLTGTHRLAGVLMAVGGRQPAAGNSPRESHQAPRVMLGSQSQYGIQADLRDVAPTVLHLLGVPPIAPMTGRVLHEMLAPPAAPLNIRPVGSMREPQPANFSQAEQETVEARLRDLGYLD